MMKESAFVLESSLLADLSRQPNAVVTAKVSGKKCSIKIVIPHYVDQLNLFYPDNVFNDIESAKRNSGIDYDTRHFGLQLNFEEPAELYLHDEDMELVPMVKQLIKRYGVLIIKNAYLGSDVRDIGHRNRFPHLKFHYDRSVLQTTVYSLYTRNPFDEEQRQPRISSTLFIPNLVAYLQSCKESDAAKVEGKGLLSNYDLFLSENMNDVISHIAVEHDWNEPEGVGEISIIDNRTALHASYNRDGFHPGYRIGVRYCS